MSKLLKAEFGGPDKALRLGNDIEIPCFVLEDGTRVLNQRAMVKALGMSRGSSAGSGGDRLAKFVGTKALQPHVSADLLKVTQSPMKFIALNGKVAYGYEATVLVDICDAVLQARKKKTLDPQQQHIAESCEALVRSFAKVGIIALVDEVTGYQAVRGREALQKFLDKFIQDEAKKWIKTFPDEFFETIFRMKGWTWNQATHKKPGVVGRYINDLVYDRLGPGVLEELRKKNPKLPAGYRKTRHFQHLTDDYGSPALKQRIELLIAFAKASGYSWPHFKRMVERALPKLGSTLLLEMPGMDED